MGKRISIFGDSISTFAGHTAKGNRAFYDEEGSRGAGVTRVEDTWWMRVIQAEGAELLGNASFSGSMVAGAGFPAGRSLERARQLLEPCGEGAAGRAGGTPDEVYVFIGINDYGWGGAEAQERGGSEASPSRGALREEGFVPGLAGEGALEGFGEAYGEMLSNIRGVAPGARIFCLTLLPGRLPGASESTFCDRMRGVPFNGYNEAIRSAAAKEGAQVLDVAAFGFDYEAADGTHPTELGMEQIAELAVAAREGRRPDEELFAGFRTESPVCGRDACVGCPHARSTGTQWSCVCERR